MTRRRFIGGAAAAGALAAAGGCCCCKYLCKSCRPGKVALQLYSVRGYTQKAGLAKTLEEVAKVGYEGVEFAGYWGMKPEDIKKVLAANGLVAVGTHVGNDQYGFDVKNGKFNADVLKKTCEFNLAYGNTTIICPGGGNIPPGGSYSTGKDGKTAPATKEAAEFTKKLCELYNKAAEAAKTMGCRIGLHNHTWEHKIIMPDGRSFWDTFFSDTVQDVCMEQDVGWSVCAGVDPCEQYVKYPHRSPTLHAKENGMGPEVKQFDAILGQPGKPGAKGVDWDALFKATDKDGVEWYVVECEAHCDSFDAVVPSFEFLRSKGRV